MTNEEAKTVLINCTTFIKDGFRFMKEEHQEQFKEAYRVALKALEKQIPKKLVEHWDEGYLCDHCPCCGVQVFIDEDEYCSKCGQALDWSDEK